MLLLLFILVLRLGLILPVALVLRGLPTPTSPVLRKALLYARKQNLNEGLPVASLAACGGNSGLCANRYNRSFETTENSAGVDPELGSGPVQA